MSPGRRGEHTAGPSPRFNWYRSVYNELSMKASAQDCYWYKRSVCPASEVQCLSLMWWKSSEPDGRPFTNPTNETPASVCTYRHLLLVLLQLQLPVLSYISVWIHSLFLLEEPIKGTVCHLLNSSKTKK